VFLGRDFQAEPNYSDEVAFLIDQEVRRLIDEAHEEATRILTDQRDRLDVVAKILIDRETIDKEELLSLLEEDPQEVWRDFVAAKEAREEESEPLPSAEPDSKQRSKDRKTAKPGTAPKPGIQPE